jgi:sugar lactone lactonase YvrE
MKAFQNLLVIIVTTVRAMTGFAQPTIVIQPTNQTVYGGSNVVFSVVVSGTGSFTYQWQCNGTNLPNAIITTVAGDGFLGGYYRGDGGPATNASFYFPSGVALDAAGNLYIADTSNNRVRKMDTNGIITTVAGNGTNGFSGDDGSATNASLGLPGGLGMNAVAGLCMDKQGNLYIADLGNNRIRKMNTNGIITTVVGNGNNTYSGDGGQAVNASLNEPTSIAIDSIGNLYIADMGNSRIRKVDTNGIITTIAGGGSIPIMWGPNSGYESLPATNAQLNLPYGVVADTNGNVFIADTYDLRIEKVDTNGILTVIAGHGMLEGFSGDGGAATNATFTRPKGVAVDPAQNLYILDTLNERVREVDSNGIINTVVGNGAGYPNGAFGGDGGTATNGSLQEPVCAVFTPSGNMYLADSWNNRIRFISFGGVPYLNLSNVSLTNNGNYCVVVTDASGSVTSSIASLTVLVPATINVQPTSQFAPVGSNVTLNVGAYGTMTLAYQWFFNGITLDGQTNSLLVLENVTTNQTGGYRVIVTNLYGSSTSSVASLVVGYPPVITSQSSNQMILIGNKILISAEVSGSGPFTYQWQFNGTNLPDNLITTIAGKSGAGYSGDGGAATNANLYSPRNVTVDTVGNIFIADSSNYRIRKVDANGIITTVAGKSGSGFSGDGGAATNAILGTARGLAIDSANNLFIADTSNNRIRKVGTDGIITTVVGNGSSGYSGDGGAATNSGLYYPYDVTVDTSGNLFIVDTRDNRIRQVTTNSLISTIAGVGPVYPSSGSYSGDGGTATNAHLNYPLGAAADTAGNVFVADTSNNRIRKVDTNGIITIVAGKTVASYSGDGGAATNAYLNAPQDVAVDINGNLFIADTGNNRIRKVNASGIITTIAGKSGSGYSGDGGVATNANLYNPAGVALDGAGNLLIADTSNNRLRKITLYANYRTLFLGNVQLSNAGNYTLIVTSPFGTVSSSDITLTVIATPVIAPTLVNADGSVTLNLSSTTNVSSRLYSTTNLTPPIIWTPIYTNPAGGSWQFTDTNAPNQPIQFFRLSTP